MDSNCKCKWGGCIPSKICSALLVIGGLNWGLVGLGMFMNSDLNVVHMILGSISYLEGIVYLLVGISAVMKLIGCKCKKCMAACASCSCATEGKMEGGM